MFFPEGQIRVQLYGKPCDMRKSFDGLQALVRYALEADPLDGALYCFINRRATHMRVLYFDRTGFCIWSKRLEAGRFVSHWHAVHTRAMDWTELKLMLEGIEPGKQRKRYRLPKSVQKSLSNLHSALLELDFPAIIFSGIQRAGALRKYLSITPFSFLFQWRARVLRSVAYYARGE